MYTYNGENARHSPSMALRDENVLLREEGHAGMPLLTEMEKRQVAAWNATGQDYPRDACIPQLIATRASITPDAVALVKGDSVLTYQELNQRANQLAHYLQSLGVCPSVLVGLCVERTLDMVVGLLGILKAGGAYVPLDSTYPAERLIFMLEDAQAPVLVTQQCLTARFPTLGAQMVCLDTGATILAQQPKTDPECAITIDDLAYIIYTSGSTGRPKGVQITHGSLLNLLYWHQDVFAVTPADRATQIASPAFDAIGWELWPYLTCGASIYLPDEETRVSPSALRDWLVEHQITITFLPTVLAESAMALEWPSMTALRFLLTGADTLHHYPSPSLPFAVINNYGPTEATVVATSGQVPPIMHAGRPPSIGRPIANTQIYILDKHLRQVPLGEPGELYIGGVGLARGYLNRPELTAERFIAHPFSNEPGARLYKTGDWARYLPDGQIAFMGRTDQQVKIRGFRIELEEIEAILNQHPAVRQSVVIAREDVPGEKQLVAYLVTDLAITSLDTVYAIRRSQVGPFVAGPQSNTSLDGLSPLSSNYFVSATELRDFLRTQLPDYMIPASFVLLEALPLTPNGKVDRAALPAPHEKNTLPDVPTTAPSTPLEKQLTAMVASLLGLKQVGIDDNFFMLGGHSLLGTQVIVLVAETFGVDIPLRTLFEASTVRQLSAEIERLLIARLEMMSDEEAQRLLMEQVYST